MSFWRRPSLTAILTEQAAAEIQHEWKAAMSAVGDKRGIGKSYDTDQRRTAIYQRCQRKLAALKRREPKNLLALVERFLWAS